jgi:hypothetical protein
MVFVVAEFGKEGAISPGLREPFLRRL